MLYENFKKGINIGGWLSQYELIASQPLTEESVKQHFETFITEEDIKRISSWQFDHIRLPLSGYLVYNRKRDCLDGLALEYIHRCVNWCSKYHLNMVLDLHDVPGNVYGAMEQIMPLLGNDVLQEQFIRIWELLAKEFLNTTGIIIMFELLNEVSDAGGAYPYGDVKGNNYDFSHKELLPWNKLYKKCISRIQSIDPERWVLVGSNGQNSVVYLKELEIVDNPYVFYNFHYYEPQVFTHQQAGFSEEMKEFNRVISYPGDISAFAAYLNENPGWKGKHALVAEELRNDKALMERLLEYAAGFIHDTGKELYCGEFGVIANTPASDAKRWLNDLTEIFNRNHIGYALWNYKCLDFGLLGLDGKPCSNLLL